MSPACGYGEATLDLVRDVLQELNSDAQLDVVTVATTAQAEIFAFPGSPTVRVEGVDIDPRSPGGVGLG